MHDVAILHHIFFSFHTEFSGFLDSRFGAVLDIIIVFDYFRADKSLLEIGMDDACALRSFPSFLVSPCTYFLYTGCEVSFEVQQLVS